MVFVLLEQGLKQIYKKVLNLSIYISSIFLKMYKFKTFRQNDTQDPEKEAAPEKFLVNQNILNKLAANPTTDSFKQTSNLYNYFPSSLRNASSQKNLSTQQNNRISFPTSSSLMENSNVKNSEMNNEPLRDVSQNQLGSRASIEDATSEIEKQIEQKGEKAFQFLSESLRNLRQKNSQLLQENNQLKIELSNSKKLNEEYQQEKVYLVTQMRRIRNNASSLQAQKLRLFEEASKYKNIISSLEGQMKIQQDQIWSLNSENSKIIEELNFVRELQSDYIKQNSFLKGQINNYQQSFQNIIDEIKVMREANKSEQDLNTKMKHLKQQIAEFRISIQNVEQKQLQNIQLKKRNNEITREMEAEIDQLKEQINYLKRQQQTQKDLMNSNLLLPQDKYLEMINVKSQKISALHQENTSLKKKNQELQSKLQQSSYLTLLAPRYHTNTNYVTKIVKQSHIQISQLKSINENIREELERLKQNYEEEINTSRNKSEQIDRLNILLRSERNRKEIISRDEISQLNNEKVRLQRKIQQLFDNQKSLRAQLLEKDRVIMLYVQKQKLAKLSQ